MSDDLEAKEPIVLDAEGHVLHDPLHNSNLHHNAQFRFVSFRSVGLIPKILIGGAFIALFFLGLTVAGIALGILFVSFLAKTIFRPRK